MKSHRNMKKKPEDVEWALTVQNSNTPINVDTSNKLLKIIEDNPDYFKWEHKYWSIPDEVHEAFHKDVSDMWQRVLPQQPPFSFSLSDAVSSKQDHSSTLSIEQLENFLKEVQLYELQKTEYERKRYKLWKKHYGPYKLRHR